MNKSTNQFVFRSFLLALCISSAAAAAFAQSTAFTYQGRLQDGGSAATGNYDFQFTLWDALSGGSQQPPSSPITVSLTSVPVSGGVFTVQLDFGAAAFPGANRWLEINVRPAGAGAFTTLSPRQPVSSTPYAIRSLNAGTADALSSACAGCVTASQIGSLNGNTITVPLQLSGDVINQAIVSAANNNSAGAGVFGSSNLVNVAGPFSAGVMGVNFGNGHGVYGSTNSSDDERGGVTGSAPQGDGVIGTGGRAGVRGSSATGNGVFGFSASSSFAGVSGFNSNGAAIKGFSDSGQGGLFFSNSGIGVSGRTNTPNFAAVNGINDSSGEAVRGQTNNGIAIHGVSNNGFAGYFDGKTFFGGNVGIGTVSPAVALEVRGDGTVASDWQQGQFRISGQANSARQLSLGYDISANVGAIQSGEANVQFTTLALNPQGGSVGIGTAVPDQKLSVNGNASKTGGGSWLSFSDERLKDIRGRFTPGLNAVMRLQPIRYQYKSDNALKLKSEGEYVGFSAQAVQRVIPEAVTKNNQGYLLVNNDPILWTMLNAIKEQQAQIEKQQKQIDELKRVACHSHAKARVCR